VLLAERLAERGETLAVAESCTGGLISHRITNLPGSSRFFLAGFVTYGNTAKTSVLGVDQRLLAEHGAVSREVVEAMALGARRQAGADWAGAVSGIAGPGGGTPGKPVGLVFTAVAGPRGTRIASHRFRGGRLEVKEQSAEAVIAMLLEAVEEAPGNGEDVRRD
jgi:PncC family amidohydrolase